MTPFWIYKLKPWLPSICLRILFSPFWFQRDSITAGNMFSLFSRERKCNWMLPSFLGSQLICAYPFPPTSSALCTGPCRRFPPRMPPGAAPGGKATGRRVRDLGACFGKSQWLDPARGNQGKPEKKKLHANSLGALLSGEGLSYCGKGKAMSAAQKTRDPRTGSPGEMELDAVEVREPQEELPLHHCCVFLLGGGGDSGGFLEKAEVPSTKAHGTHDWLGSVLIWQVQRGAN